MARLLELNGPDETLFHSRDNERVALVSKCEIVKKYAPNIYEGFWRYVNFFQ